MVFNGIDKIAARFKAKVDCQKFLKFVATITRSQRASNRRSPNMHNYKLKWTDAVIMPQFQSKCSYLGKSNLMVTSKWCSSECAIFS